MARERELEFLEQVVRATATASDHHALLCQVVDQATDATGTQVCSIYLWDDAEHALTLTATNGLSQAGVGKVKLGLGEGITGWVAAERQPMAVRDVRESSRFKWIADLDDERYVAMLSVPIVSKDRVVGVMNVQAIAPHVFTQEEIDFVLAIAAQVAGIIELSSLRQRLTHQLEIEREMVMRLSVLNSAKSDLLAMLSHDFRGPLTSVRAYIHGLRPKLVPTEAEVCDHIETEVDALESMVTNLMFSLELESQQTPLLHLETFDLIATARDVTRRFRSAAPRHSLSVSATTLICKVRADQTRVRSVLINLVGNAIKYSPDGGSVWVRVEPNERVVEVSVQDEGIGIDTRDAATIFERYGRGVAALERGIGGHGLGLFICKQVVESHHGEIFARSLTNGSCFVFTLPIQAEEL